MVETLGLAGWKARRKGEAKGGFQETHIIISLRASEKCEGQVKLKGKMMNLTVLHAHYAPAVLTTFSLFLNHITLTPSTQMEEYFFWNIILPDLPIVGLVSMSSLQNGPPEHPTLSSHLVSRPCITHCFHHRTRHYLKFSSLFVYSLCLLYHSVSSRRVETPSFYSITLYSQSLHQCRVQRKRSGRKLRREPQAVMFRSRWKMQAFSSGKGVVWRYESGVWRMKPKAGTNFLFMSSSQV